MNNDRELLELAAKAAGYVSHGYGELCGGSPFLYLQEADFTGIWSSLTDDGDALRLAVKLRIRFDRHTVHPFVAAFCNDVAGRFEEPDNGDPYAATRRAITRAAAEIGKSLIATGETI
jgi:hypothetical protein